MNNSNATPVTPSFLDLSIEIQQMIIDATLEAANDIREFEEIATRLADVSPTIYEHLRVVIRIRRRRARDRWDRAILAVDLMQEVVRVAEDLFDPMVGNRVTIMINRMNLLRQQASLFTLRAAAEEAGIWFLTIRDVDSMLETRVPAAPPTNA